MYLRVWAAPFQHMSLEIRDKLTAIAHGSLAKSVTKEMANTHRHRANEHSMNVLHNEIWDVLFFFSIQTRALAGFQHSPRQCAAYDRWYRVSANSARPQTPSPPSKCSIDCWKLNRLPANMESKNADRWALPWWWNEISQNQRTAFHVINGQISRKSIWNLHRIDQPNTKPFAAHQFPSINLHIEPKCAKTDRPG